jgi:outer membrane protein assembly factor BamC
MSRRIFIFSLLTLSISACSSVENAKRAAGDFDYAKASETKPLIIPKGLDTPVYSNQYALVNNINTNGPVGKKVDVRAPALVLPVAASSRVELNSTKAKIWFDKVLENKDLKTFILNAIKDKLSEDGVELRTIDVKQHRYESSWYHKTKEKGFWLWSYTDTLSSMRFEYQLETKPHGRSVAVTVKLVEYKDKNGNNKMDPIDQQRAEVRMLNNITEHVDYLYRKEKRENRIMRATQKIVAIGDNPNKEAAYIIELEKDYLWDNLPDFFEKYGFTLDDLNESKNIYYVTYVKPDNSLWDSIWGDDKAIIDLANAKYQFKLTTMGNKTALTIYDEAGHALSKETLQRIFSVMEPALSFRN